MKQGIHPDYVMCTVRCTCGNTWVTRSTKSEMTIDLCDKCHPFYTGQQKLVDTGGRVQRFSDKFGGAAQAQLAKAKAAKEAKAKKAAEEEAARKAAAEAKAAAKAKSVPPSTPRRPRPRLQRRPPRRPLRPRPPLPRPLPPRRPPRSSVAAIATRAMARAVRIRPGGPLPVPWQMPGGDARGLSAVSYTRGRLASSPLVPMGPGVTVPWPLRSISCRRPSASCGVS